MRGTLSRGVYGLRVLLCGALQLDCGARQCRSLDAGTILERRPRVGDEPEMSPKFYRLSLRKGDTLSLRIFQTIALQCVDALMADPKIVLCSVDQIHFPRRTPHIKTYIDADSAKYNLDRALFRVQPVLESEAEAHSWFEDSCRFPGLLLAGETATDPVAGGSQAPQTEPVAGGSQAPETEPVAGGSRDP
ncbi:hypothetical protein GNI_182690, partial [Gregarina niphandrodes]